MLVYQRINANLIKIDDQILKNECEHSAELGISVINQKNNSQNIKRQEKQPMSDIRSIYSVCMYIYIYYGSKMWCTIFLP